MNQLKIIVLGVYVLIVAMVLGSCSDNDSTLVQFERTGLPAVNAAVIPVGMKDAFNQGTPATDAQFLATAEATITGLRNAVNAVVGFPAEDVPGVTAAQVAAVLIPDVITVDFSQPLNFPNGRALEDDVIDVALGLVLNRGNVLGGGPGVSDGIANDSIFLPTFPYLGVPLN